MHNGSDYGRKIQQIHGENEVHYIDLREALFRRWMKVMLAPGLSGVATLLYCVEKTGGGGLGAIHID